MRTSWSLGPLFIVVGAIAISPFGTRTGPLTPVALFVAAALVAAGALFLTKRPFAFWVGIAAAGLATLTGIVALAGLPQFALPIKPWMSIVLGIYLGIRTITARVAGAPRRFIPTDEDYERKPPTDPQP
jgi:hypothetical protein